MPPTFTDEGVRAAALIRQQDPGVKLLVLSQYVEERYASELIADSPHGLGYVLKDRVADVDDFLSVVADVGAGGTWLRSEEHTSELQSRGHLVCRLLLAHN